MADPRGEISRRLEAHRTRVARLDRADLRVAGARLAVFLIVLSHLAG